MIKGIGCDLVEISRVGKLIDNEKFVEKVYTPSERGRITAQGVEAAAGIWSAREAVVKAMGTGFTGFTMRDVEICKKESGEPYVRLYGRAYEKFCQMRANSIYISITHEKCMAIAFAIME